MYNEEFTPHEGGQQHNRWQKSKKTRLIPPKPLRQQQEQAKEQPVQRQEQQTRQDRPRQQKPQREDRRPPREDNRPPRQEQQPRQEQKFEGKGGGALRMVILGGCGEIGKNMTAFEYGDSIIIVDAGLSFPNSAEMPGIDYVIPDYAYLTQNRRKIKGLVVTHGHEDHIGAIPFMLKELNVPVYGSSLALAIIQHKLIEHGINKPDLNDMSNGDKVKLGCFEVEFIRVTHSIAGAFALAITTPVGMVFHTGDFKIDHTPIDGRPTDLARIAEIGRKGVLLMLQDSTNVERSGYSMSEKNVGISLDNIFAQNSHKRLIVATFASNVHRVQQIINCAVKYGRKIAFCGRSMINIANIASRVKELSYPMDAIVEIEKIGKIPYDKLCIISTGTQGEPESALTRMSNSESKTVHISETDTVIFSSSPIPGNESLIYGVINNLYRQGADVIYKALAEVHVSGHACQEELKLMLSLVRPTYFIPVHGEFRHLKQHVALASNLGIDPANMLIPENGNVIEIRRNGLRRGESVPAGSILLDGSVASENSEMVLRDRKKLSEDGFVIAVISVSSGDGESMEGAMDRQIIPYFITRGLNIPEAILEEMKELVVQRINSIDYKEGGFEEIKPVIRKSLQKHLFAKFKKEPMILPIIVET